MRCAVCGAGSPRLKHVKAEAEIFRCGRCGLEFWNPAPGFRAEDVYDAASWSATVSLSAWSVLNESTSIKVPDFTAGAWETNPRNMDINLENGGGNTSLLHG